MDFKVVISNSGDEKLFKSLSKEVERRLPNAAVEWKRSYGRPSKNVVLQANFVNFDSVQLTPSVDSASRLTSNPMLHIFWTSCLENDLYKSKTKGLITQWQKVLKEKQIVDWLIVHVVNQDSSKTNKPKIQLPRSSVFDKIKTEFRQKNQERCIQLWEPDKETLFTKSGESWEVLLSSLRNLLLESFGRHLDWFEDQIRVLREKYADPEWPFVEYFIVHEELALIYQSVTLKEDALVQYDEVDALLSQFIINSNGKVLPKWLEELCLTPTSWDGVLLASAASEHNKALIKSKKASLLEFRNYLFSKQVKLLIKMKRKWEIPSRLLEFLFATFQELKLLKIDISDSKVALWIILTCMQLLQHLESLESNDLSYHSTKAQLQDYMRQKLYSLGTLTGLYCNRDQTESEKDLVVILMGGIGKYETNTHTHKDTSTNHAVQIIKDAFSCSLNYKKFYLDTSIKCMELFYDIKRLHFGLVVAIDIAKFYLEHGNYLEAEPLLEKAWTVYKQQKWQTLYTDVLIPLADCQFKHSLHDRYLNSIALLACAHCLPYDIRQHYSNEVLKLSQNNTLKLLTINTDPILNITNIKIDLVKNKGHIGDEIKIKATLINQLTTVLPCQIISITLKHSALSDPDSFIHVALSSQKSLFDPKDYGMNISLTNNDSVTTPKEESATKEALTPSNLLKRLKSHRRTWSRNKNVIEETKSVESLTSSPVKEILHKSHSAEDILDTGVKRTLFKEPSTMSLPNGDISNGDTPKRNSTGDTPKIPSSIDNPKKLSFNDITKKTSTGESPKRSSTGESPKRSSLLEISNTTEGNNNVKNQRSVTLPSLDLSQQLPLATSSVSESAIDRLVVQSLTRNESLNETVFNTTENIEDLSLTSETDLTLLPGENIIELNSKIITEGRYLLHSIHCTAGQLQFKSTLKLPSTSNSFFVVADPPKISWTTSYVADYLLSGSKQRLHVTLLNGPGNINEGSVLQINSGSGLQFFPLNDSSIEVYPLERGGAPREAVMSITKINENEASICLPACKPYERVNLYFDVLAPIHIKNDSSLLQHEILFVCNWLKEYVNTKMRLDCIFYEPFNIKHTVSTKGTKGFVHLVVTALNPVPLLLVSPKLLVLNDNVEDGTFKLMTLSREVRLYGNEEYHYLWHVNLETLKERMLDINFQLSFHSKDNEGDFGIFEEKFQLAFTEELFVLNAIIENKEINKTEPTIVNVSVTRNKTNNSKAHRLCVMLNPKDTVWKDCADKGMHEITFTETSNTTILKLKITTEYTGYVIAPQFMLCEIHDMKTEENAVMTTNFKQGCVKDQSLGNIIFIKDSVITQV